MSETVNHSDNSVECRCFAVNGHDCFSHAHILVPLFITLIVQSLTYFQSINKYKAPYMKTAI